MQTEAVRVEVTWGRSDDRELLRRLVAANLGVDPRTLTEGRLCPDCGGSDHGRPSVRHGAVSTGWVSLARHEEVALAAWSPDAAVGVDVEDATAGDAWVRREARGKADGSGITGRDPEQLDTRLLTSPPGLLAALAVDAPQPWSVTVT